MKKTKSKQKLTVLNYSTAALVGGFVAAQAVSFALLPLYIWLFEQTTAEAVFLTSMSSYLFFFIFFITSFCLKTANRAWLFNFTLTLLGYASYWYFFVLANPNSASLRLF